MIIRIKLIVDRLQLDCHEICFEFDYMILFHVNWACLLVRSEVDFK